VLSTLARNPAALHLSHLSRMKFPSLLPAVLCLAVVVPALAEEKRGDNPDAPALSAQEQLKRFKVPPGFEVQLVASEPEIQKPVNINFDAAGRLWVTGSEMYPWPAASDAIGKTVPDFAKVYEDIANAFGSRGKAPEIQLEGKDTIRVLSNLGPDGKARTVRIFADKLNIPTGIQPMPRKPGEKGDTVIAYSIPNIWRFSDTDGDGTADKREPLYEGFGYLDTHGMSSNYIHWIDGWIYGCHGFRNQSEIKDRNGNVLSMNSGNTYRFKPDGSKIEYFTHGQTNPFGLTFDPKGNLYSADSHSKPIYMLIRGGYYEGIGKQHDGLGFAPRITDDDHGSSAIAGIMYYADDKWPAEFQGNLFNGNPVTRAINRAKLDWHGSTPKATRLEDFVTCDDPWFRPVQVKLGPDGAMYIADFYNPIIGHYEVPLSDPRRDRKHGRIWRVVWKGNSPTPDAPAGGERASLALPDLSKLDGLVDALANPNLELRRLATHEIIARADELHGPDAPLTTRLRVGWERATPNQKVHALSVIATLEERKMGGDLAADHLAALIKTADPIVTATAIRFLRDVDKSRLDLKIASDLTEAAVLRIEDATVERALCAFIAQHPTTTGFSTLLQRLKEGNAGPDLELTYARQVALREALLSPAGYTWAQNVANGASAQVLAEVSLAVPKPEAADFLTRYLERVKFRAPRIGDYLRHIVLHTREAGDLTALVARIADLPDLALPQRLAIADGLSEAARKRGLKLPDSANAWLQQTMIAALDTTDAALLDKAIAAVKDASLEAKAEPLKKVVFAAGTHGPRRAAALEALMNLPIGVQTAAAALADTSSASLRKKAAELLAQQAGSRDASISRTAQAALLAALPTAPWELAATIGGGLAKADSGTEQLLAVIESGKVSPALLRNNAVAGPLGGRSQPLRDRVTKLTADLPPEDARLDTLIAQRVEKFRAGGGDKSRGAQLFEQQCAACHKLKNIGGNIGPNLDGMSARGPHRLIEDILDPNRNVDPAFRQTIVETNDGRMLAGVNLRTEGEVVLLNDAAGQEQSIPKAQIKSQTQSRMSLMPPTFEQTLPEKDFNDLLAYLLDSGEK
jgi:putative heme-binding domain-containing protein